MKTIELNTIYSFTSKKGDPRIVKVIRITKATVYFYVLIDGLFNEYEHESSLKRFNNAIKLEAKL